MGHGQAQHDAIISLLKYMSLNHKLDRKCIISCP